VTIFGTADPGTDWKWKAKAADTRQTNVGQQMLDNSMAEMADSADDDDVAAAVISVTARKRKRRRPKSVWVQSWTMQR